MLSKYGRHFDVHPKGWRMRSDLLENASYGLELLTPVFPHLFVYLRGAAAGAGRAESGMIQVTPISQSPLCCTYDGWPTAVRISVPMVCMRCDVAYRLQQRVASMQGLRLRGTSQSWWRRVKLKGWSANPSKEP